MNNPDDTRKKDSDAAGGFKSSDTEDTGNATQESSHPGKPWQEAPGQEDDSIESYTSQQHNVSDAAASNGESSPSGGWRFVYSQMGVRR